jgi:hypothetical protein
MLNGIHDRNAQQVEFSLHPIRPHEMAAEASVLTVYGVSWEQVSQYANLVGARITITGGMTPGLPLATHQSQHNGMLISGVINQCWGNWIGTDMSIGMLIQYAGGTSGGGAAPGGGGAAPGGGGGGGDGAPSAQSLSYNRTGGRSIDRRPLPLSARRRIGASGSSPIVMPASGFNFVGDIGGFLGGGGAFTGAATSTIGGMATSFFGGGGGLAAPLNFIHDMQANMPLSSAIQQTLSKVFPNAQLKVNISPALKLAYQDAGMYQSMEQYASYIKELSHSILGVKGYSGVITSILGNKVTMTDFTQPSPYTGNVHAEDLIGQPSWIDMNSVNIITVLRGDINVDDSIQLPPNTLFNVGPEAGAVAGNQRSKLTFQGAFRVQKIHHVGDFRNPDGVQWSSHFTCVTPS